MKESTKMEEALTVDMMLEILTDLKDNGYGSKPIGLETLCDITLCISPADIHYDTSYDALIISTTNI